MVLVRYYITRVAGAQAIRPSPFSLPASHRAYRRNVANTSGGSIDNSGTPPWMWWTAGSSAAVAFYLWNQGHKNAKTAVGREVQEPQGANQEYVKRTEGN